jgi:5-methylcytosine-specific restriction protein A
MSRREFSRAVMREAFARAAGKCERCGNHLYTGKYQYDHIIADSIGGEPTLDNCAVLCTGCHDEKTAKLDTPRAAKTKRQHLAHIGARPRSRMPGSRTSNLKKKMNGQTVRREEA